MKINLKYTSTIVLILMMLALSRGFVLHDFIHFDAFSVHAEDGGDGGSAGAGAGNGGSAGSGAGDGSSAGAGAGDGTSAGAGAGAAPAGEPAPVPAPSPAPVEPAPVPVPVKPVPPVYGVCGELGAYKCAVGNISEPSGDASIGWSWYCDGTPNDIVHRSPACFYKPAPVWTNYCTGALDANPWQIWAYDNSKPKNYKFIGTDPSCAAPIIVPPAIVGCMDKTATNYNPAATSQVGVTCTYPPALPTPIYGCMDVTATNYNPAATSQTGVTCTYGSNPPGPAAPTCVLTAAPASVNSGDRAVLSWTTTNPNTFSIDHGIGSVSPAIRGSATTTALTANTTFTGTVVSPTGQSVSCTATVTIATSGGGAGGCTSNCGGGGAGGGGGGGGGGGAGPAPTISLASLMHVNAQPLAYLYLSQIPQTGLELGPVATVFYWIVLIGIAFALAYLVLFGAWPRVARALSDFGARVGATLNAPEMIPATVAIPMPTPVAQAPAHQDSSTAPEAPRGYSSYDGFKSFAQGRALSIEDIVKGLAREHAGQKLAPTAEPIYEDVEPIYEQVEPIAPGEELPEREAVSNAVPNDVRGFTVALLEGDREAVFAGLRQHVRGAGAPEKLLSSVACLLDDAYRARIDGSACDPDIMRMTARLSTPALESLAASLTTAIDSSYSTGVTGAKLALTRALSILGA